MAEEHHIIPVWFFIGVILLIYGLLILGSGILHVSQPPATVFGELHPDVWWGALHPAVWWGAILCIVGGVYVYMFRPGRQ